MTRTMQREAAYNAFDSERNYQDAMQGNAKPHPQRADEIRILGDKLKAGGGNGLTLGEGVLVLDALVQQTKAAWYKAGGYNDALEHVRKIGGVATQLLESYGAPMRPISGVMKAQDAHDATKPHAHA